MSSINSDHDSEKVIKEILSEVDENNDNEISFEEFYNAVTKFMNDEISK